MRELFPAFSYQNKHTGLRLMEDERIGQQAAVVCIFNSGFYNFVYL
jgi:cobalamin synthase